MHLVPTPYSKDYEITDAMFGAFRTAGGPAFFWKLLGWETLFYFALYLLLFVPIGRTYMGFFASFIEAQESGAVMSEAEMFDSMGSILLIYPLIFLLTIASLVLHGILRTTFYRGYFTGETGGAFPFKFGDDEVRQILSVLGYYGLFFLVYFGFILIIGIVFSTMGAALGESAPGLMVLFGFLSVIPFCVGFIWVAVTFSPAGALTFMRGTTHILAARHVSKNRFWALLGSLLVAWLIGYVVYTAVYTVGMFSMLASFFDGAFIEAVETEDPAQIMNALSALVSGTGFKISFFIALLLSSMGQAFYLLIIAGPTAYFTQQWAEAGAVECEENLK